MSVVSASTPKRRAPWIAAWTLVPLLASPASAVECTPEVERQESEVWTDVANQAFAECDCPNTKPAAFTRCMRRKFRQAIRSGRLGKCIAAPPRGTVFMCSVDPPDKTI
jgi:hypothetical protein